MGEADRQQRVDRVGRVVGVLSNERLDAPHGLRFVFGKVLLLRRQPRSTHAWMRSTDQTVAETNQKIGWIITE